MSNQYEQVTNEEDDEQKVIKKSPPLLIDKMGISVAIFLLAWTIWAYVVEEDRQREVKQLARVMVIEEQRRYQEGNKYIQYQHFPTQQSTQKKQQQPHTIQGTQHSGGIDNLQKYGQIAGINNRMVETASSWVQLKHLPPTHPLALQEEQYYEEKYRIGKYSEKGFCVVVPTYNNKASDRYKYNLLSILQQQYSAYHVVVIDDASTDGSAQLIDQLVEERGGGKVKVIHNEQQRKALGNIRMAAFEHCHSDQIMMVVDGDDELVGKQVLKLFNAVFEEHGVWFMYTNFISSQGTLGYSRPFRNITIESNTYRKTAFITSHLRAFYVQLVRNIKTQHLQDENHQYFKAANDVAICIPILEMSHKHVIYIPQITYLYNSNTGLNNHRIRLAEQTANNKKIRKYPKYEALESLFDDTL